MGLTAIAMDSRIDLNRCGIENPGLLWPGSVLHTALLGYSFVRDMVPSKICKCLCEEDRGGKATAYLCHFRLRQRACARAGKNSIILFGHKVNLSKKIQPLQMTRASKIIAPQNCYEEFPEC